MRKLKSHSFSLPPPVVDWLKNEADLCQTTTSAHLTLLLSIFKQTGSNAELQRRVSALEHRLKAAGL